MSNFRPTKWMLPLGLASRGDMVVVVVGMVDIIVRAFVFVLLVDDVFC